MTVRTHSLAGASRYEPQQFAQARSASVLDEHARQVASAFEAARAEGLLRGRAEVDAAVARHDAAVALLARAAAALMGAVEQLTNRDRDDLGLLEQQSIRFATELAEHLVGRELRSCDDALAAAVVRAMRLAPQRGPVLLRVNPADCDGASTSLEHAPDLLARVEFLADPAVEPGGCIAVVGPLQIDAQLSPAMGRVRAVIES